MTQLHGPTALRPDEPSRPHDTAGGAPPEEERSGVLAELWARFHERHDRESRSALVTAYYPLVRHVARRVAASLAHQVELGDLEGYGAEGLLDAVDRFDAALGAQFTTFAAHRIRGAIYDGVRRTDWAPRSVRRREREIRANYAELCAAHGREPTEAEEASALGVAIDILRSAKGRIDETYVGSLDSARPDTAACEPSDPDDEPLAVCVANETSEALRSWIGSLDERERMVTALSYGEGLTLAEIGTRLGVTESRVCQIRAGAIKQLRAYARAQGLARL